MQSSMSSPFVTQQADSDSWVLWSQKESLINLIPEKQTDGRYDLMHDDERIDSNPPITNSIINNMMQTNRYHSVLSRMDQASKRASAYSAWNA